MNHYHICKLLSLLFFLPIASYATDDCDYEKIRGSLYHTKNEDLLARAVEKNCPALMETALRKEKEGDLYRATQGFMLNVLDHISLSLQGMKGMADDEPAAVEMNSKIKIIGRFGEFLKEKCPDEGKDTQPCKARNTFKDYSKKLHDKFSTLLAEEEAEAKEESFKNSPDGLIQRACACDKFIDGNQKIIDRQKEIGKVSGTMNMVTLNNAGSQIVDLKRIKKEVAAKYKASTKKELKNYKCKNTEELTNPLLDGTGINGI